MFTSRSSGRKRGFAGSDIVTWFIYQFQNQQYHTFDNFINLTVSAITDLLNPTGSYRLSRASSYY